MPGYLFSWYSISEKILLADLCRYLSHDTDSAQNVQRKMHPLEVEIGKALSLYPPNSNPEKSANGKTSRPPDNGSSSPAKIFPSASLQIKPGQCPKSFFSPNNLNRLIRGISPSRRHTPSIFSLSPNRRWGGFPKQEYPPLPSTQTN